MRILAISGSLRATSTNTRLIRCMMQLVPENMEISLYEGLADLPPFTPDQDGDASPGAVRSLRKQLETADGVLLCTPEYAFGVPGTLKNALDWTVSSGDFWGKPVAAISTSSLWSGGDKAHASLLLTLTALGARVPAGATLMIPIASKKLDANGDIVDSALTQALIGVLAALASAIEA